jgi:hypothetical protein
MLPVGMFDSPYVRRVAISMRRPGLPAHHRQCEALPEFAAT